MREKAIPSKDVFIAGGTGFVGVMLANRLAAEGRRITVMGPSSPRPPRLKAGVRVIQGDGRVPGEWQKEYYSLLKQFCFGKN